MPLLSAFIANLFGGLIGWFGTVVTKRVATYAAFIVLLGAAAAAMWSAMVALIAGFSAALPGFLSVPLTWVIPWNFEECLAAWGSTELICAGYRWHKETIKVASYIS